MLNKKINNFANVDNDVKQPSNQSADTKPKKDNKQPSSVRSSEDRSARTKSISKWILSIILLALIVFCFWWSCAPKSQTMNVRDYQVTTTTTSEGQTLNELHLWNTKDHKKEDPGIVIDLDGTRGSTEYYLTTGDSVVFTAYAKSEKNGTINFRLEEMKKIVDAEIQYALTIGSSTKPITFTIPTADPGLEPIQTWLLDAVTTGASIPSNSMSFASILLNLLPTIVLVGLMIWMYNRMAKLQGGAMGGEDSIFGMGKSQAKIAHSNVKFSDVAGIEEEKAELIEIVDYLKNPDKYAAMGARTPRGVILYGPPGTGKTLLAKAVAGEAGVPFFQVSGSAFEDMLVGVGAKRVRDLFTKAKKAAPAIIFIDELDSVASKRGKYDVSGSSGLADQTINQLLAEMDGFSTRTGIVVMAATNRLDVIDDAILRPGRFDRHIQVTLPDIKEREAILKIHARNKNLSSKVNLNEIARRTPGFSGAQLENVLNEATLLAVRFNKSAVGMDEIDEAIDRVIAGPAKKSRVITEDEKKQIAYHEAGHALVGLHLPGSDVVEKITIIPRGMAAGYTLSTPEKQEIQIQKKSDLLAIITSTLGGRAAEEVIYGPTAISTGAANDLYKVTNIVRSMVTQLGMTEIGMTQFIPSEGAINPNQIKLYSDETANKIDAQIEKIIQDQYLQAKELISKNKKELDLIVESLLLLETIVKNQIDYIHKNLKLPEEAIARKNELANSKKESKENKESSLNSDQTKSSSKSKK